MASIQNNLDSVASSAAPSTVPSPSISRSPSLLRNRNDNRDGLRLPVSCPPMDVIEDSSKRARKMVLEMQDGSAFDGFSFGAERSVAGECVFQTGMVGYPESLTDPSYSGQILVLTYPLVGSYGVPPQTEIDLSIPLHFESVKIHVAALVIATYSGSEGYYSHHLANSSLGKWLEREGVPAVWGVDTREIVKRIREKGVMLGRVMLEKAELAPIPADERGRAAVNGVKGIVRKFSLGSKGWRNNYLEVPFEDPNVLNLVKHVSVDAPKLYTPSMSSREDVTPKLINGRPLRILAIDVGMKYNQIRCFLRRGVQLKVVPWDYDFVRKEDEDFDGIFVSNGPGDPETLADSTVARIREAMYPPPGSTFKKRPMFGICLGHQLFGLASGAKTSKLGYGNRGMNIPCTSMISGRCYITSQNHGYAVDVSTVDGEKGWSELFVNANDGSNEGIICDEDPYFSVQFHPEATPGPQDTAFLFDVFIEACQKWAEGEKVKIRELMPGGTLEENEKKHPRVHVKKVLVLGSGGLSIGQAGEFDYSGSQAIKALKEEGIYTILVNPNIATIQTSKGLADKVYFLPVAPDFVRKIIQHERPDGIYVTFGGQTALNVGIKMKDEFAALGVQVLGTPISTIITTEDRQLFADAMAEIGEKCAKSFSATSVEECLEAAEKIGYPVIARAAFALGGLGSGFANSKEELDALCKKAFATSPQVLVEKSMKGWKEIEYEVVRDCRDNCITVCNMENFDPLGIHTGDSIVVAPSQTLSDADYQMLRNTAVNVIRHLGVVGECNIQYALNPDSKEYCIIEVNARLSRSSALASKATGYPLAFIAAKLGLGIPLNDIKNTVTKLTSACFEPSLDYIVVKIPRWDLKKFNRVSTLLSSSMKSVGEVMAIGRTFEETMQKAIRSIDFAYAGFGKNDDIEDIETELENPSDKRLFAIANALHAGRSVDDIWSITKIDKWFLRKLENIVRMEKVLSTYHMSNISKELVRQAKQMGFADRQISKCTGSNEMAVRRFRQEASIYPFVKQIDTVAAEFPAFTNYLYMTYNASENDVEFDDQGVMVLGSGVYRIGSSVEFDWCAVRCIRTLRAKGTKTIMVNYNPETVSTDYDEADRLYFENISLETVMDIYELEHSSGVVLSMGGQTPNNIALPLHRQNVRILGTSPELIDTAENRYKFSRMLDKIGVDQPLWKELSTIEEAHKFCSTVDFPVLVRPSYVLSGAAMNVVYSADDLSAYLSQAAEVSREHPVVISKYIQEAKEIEMDAVARNGEVIMHYISEHVENAGVHSGDATLIHPPQDLDPETVRRIELATKKIGNALNVTGPFNIQFIAKNNEIKVIECNVRASRSFPFVSKVTGIDAIEIATKVMLGMPVEPYPQPLMPSDYVGIKVPQFSFSRLSGADPVLGVEMASTGEVACFGKDRYEAYLKALLSTGISLPKKNVLFSIGSYKEKLEMLPSVQKLHRAGFNLFATAGTADFIQEHGIPVKYLEVLPESEHSPDQKSEYSLTKHLANNLIDLFINLPSKNHFRRPASYMSKGYRSRRMAVDFAVPLITNVKCAKLFVEAIIRKPTFELTNNDFKTSFDTILLPGFVGTQIFVASLTSGSSTDVARATRAAIHGGFTCVQLSAWDASSGSVSDPSSFEIAQSNATGLAYCDYVWTAAATASNASKVSDEVIEGTNALAIYCDPKHSGDSSKVASIAKHFSTWPQDKLIITEAKTTDLASVLLLASLHNRTVHVTNVQSKDDVLLIAMSKGKGLNVTCDATIYSLFFTAEEFPGATCLPSSEDQKALWENLKHIDVLSIGTTPFQLASELNKTVSPTSGFLESTQLLLTAINDGRLTVEGLIAKMVDNPTRIFSLPEQPDTSVEVELNRQHKFESIGSWSPLDGKAAYGSIHRVVLRGQTALLDGQLLLETPIGQNVNDGFVVSRTADKKKASRFSVSGGQRPILSPPRPKAEARSPQPRSAVLNDVPSDSMLKPSVLSLMSATDILKTPSRSIAQHPAFHGRSILTVKQFNRNDLHALFGLAQELRVMIERGEAVDLLKGKVLCTLFFEASTRTSASFDAAMKRLGGSVVAVTPDKSSVTKGESLPDTIRTLGCYADGVVIRHPAVGSVQTAAKFSPVPIINAGDGIGEHPTQALLDVFTIREELGTVNGLTITIVGDLKNGRTVHSLVRILSLYQVSFIFVSPPSLSLPESVKSEPRKQSLSMQETTNLESVIGQTDVLYVTRVQQERFASEAEYDAVKDAYIVNNELLSNAKSHMIVMHPLPRNAEIDPEVDFDHLRAAYFRQMRYGLFVRMALLSMVLG